MTRKLTILVDMDGIVVDLAGTWYPAYNAASGDNLTVEKVKDWGLSAAKYPDILFSVLKKPGFLLRPDPLPGALEGLRQLHEEGHRVVIVTAGACPNSFLDKALWLQHWLPWFDHKNLVLTHAKELVRGDILFDDGPHNVASYHNAWPSSFIASILYPYNTDALGPCDLVAGTWEDPAAAWREFLKWVGQVARLRDPEGKK